MVPAILKAEAEARKLYWDKIKPNVTTAMDWPKSPSLSLDTAVLEDQKFDAVLVLKDGVLVFENYGPKASAQEPRSIKSVTKPIVAATLAIAATRGGFDLAAPIERFGGCAVPPELKPISALQLVDMAAGLPWDDVWDPYLTNNWPCAILGAKAQPDAKGKFRYSGTQTQLAAQYLADQTGRTLAQNVQRLLLSPIGAHIDFWHKQRRGPYLAGSDLVIGPADMLAFGALILNDGVHKGKRIIPKPWLEKIWTSGVHTKKGTVYSGGWWRRTHTGKDVLQASGYGGQQIVIVPDHRAVIVISGKNDLGAEEAFARRGKQSQAVISEILKQF